MPAVSLISTLLAIVMPWVNECRRPVDIDPGADPGKGAVDLDIRVDINMNSGHGAKRASTASTASSASTASTASTASPASTASTASPPPLCERRLVAETCRRLNQGSREYFGTSTDADLSIVHAAELAEQFMVSRKSIIDFLEAIDLINEEQGEAALELGAYAVKCQELCMKTISSLPSEIVPPSSDVACYQVQGMARPVCDIDVSDSAFAGMKFGEGLAKRSRAAFGENRHNSAEKIQRVKTRKGNQVTYKDVRRTHTPVRSEEDARDLLAHLKAQEYPDRTIGQLKRVVANTFRIYPLISIGVKAAAAEKEAQPSLLEFGSSALAMNTRGRFTRTAPSSNSADTCAGLKKSDCGENSSCTWKWTGNWRTSCIVSDVTAGEEQQVVPSTNSTDTCAGLKKSDCDESSSCTWKWTGKWRTSCIVSDVTAGEEQQVAQDVDTTCPAATTCEGMKKSACGDSPNCAWKDTGNWRTSCKAVSGCVDHAITGYVEEDGSVMGCSVLAEWCSEEDIQDSCAKSCGLSCPPEQIESWEADALKTGVKAQAYVSRALRRMAGHEIPEMVTRWFGNNEEDTRAHLRSVLVVMNEVLSNVDYDKTGEDCDATTYAYVLQDAPWNRNRRGQFVFYVCSLYMRVPELEQIETLTHEACHHNPMLLDDVCESGSEEDGDCIEAYGREACLELAKTSPAKAMRNADTLSFFINDAATLASY